MAFTESIRCSGLALRAAIDPFFPCESSSRIRPELGCDVATRNPELLAEGSGILTFSEPVSHDQSHKL